MQLKSVSLVSPGLSINLVQEDKGPMCAIVHILQMHTKLYSMRVYNICVCRTR